MGPVRQNPIQRTVSLFICVCITLCTIVAHNIAQNRPDSLPPYPPDNQKITTAPMMSIWGNGGKSTYEFLLVFHSHYVPILHCLWDIARHWSKIAVLTYPTSIWHPCRRRPHWNFAEIFGIRKLEGLPFLVV